MRAPARSTWTRHRWLGLAVLAPLLWWTLTALVFALRPMDEIRGRTFSAGRPPEPAPLDLARWPGAEALAGATAVAVRRVEGAQVAVVERAGAAPEVLDLAAGTSLGAAIPLEWALAAARRDFAGPAEPEAVYLFPREGPGRRVAGAGPATAEPPEEYAGPRPVYAVHLAGRPGMHLYVDALDGTVRARRTDAWRLYDLAFRLHGLDFLPDPAKRAVMAAVVAAWLALGATGLRLALAWLARRAAGRSAAPPA